jgi:hypothetical protein
MTDWLRAYRARQVDLDGRARERLRADETAITGNHRRSVRLEQVWREFRRHPSPWMLTAMLVTALSAWVVAGDWQLRDALVPVVMVAVFPFVEWVVHVCVLHWRPRRIGGLTIDPLLARRHRAHHADPRDVPLVFIPWRALVWVIAASAVAAVLVFPRLGTAFTFLTSAAVLGLLYEWTHYLIHSDYRPRSRAYRALWRNHRLHHYKNEHYWFTITTAGTADRVVRTYPDPQEVETSPTVRDLHARESRSGVPHEPTRSTVDKSGAGRPGSVSRWRGNLPQRTDRHGAQLVAERQGGRTGVEDDAGDEVVAEAIGETA